MTSGNLQNAEDYLFRAGTLFYRLLLACFWLLSCRVMIKRKKIIHSIRLNPKNSIHVLCLRIRCSATSPEHARNAEWIW